MILATDVAEASLTLPNLTHVVLSGVHKVPVYDPVTQVSTLERVAITKDNELQMIGRVGRTEDSTAILCYDEEFGFV